MAPRGKRLKPAGWGFLIAAVLFTVYCAYSVSHLGSGSSGDDDGGHGAKPVVLGRKRALSTDADDDLNGSGSRKMSVGRGSGATASKPCSTAVATSTGAQTALVYNNNPRMYHFVTTAQGFANHWQARIHYYWYKKQRDICRRSSTPCDMGGFTRLLHSGQPDDLMDEVPTVVVDPLPPSASNGSSYVVLNRPYAFMEWLKRVSIPEQYIVMGEGDHLLLRPIPNLMNGESSGAALFSYIVPNNYPNIVRKFIGDVSDDEVKKVPQIGNSPTFVSIEEFRVLAPLWYNTTMEIFNDKEAHEAWNWVLEMYGYTLAVYRAGQHRNLKQYSELLAHPPFDKGMKDYKGDEFYILHLTYPCTYNKTGGFTENVTEMAWKFDKRSYMGAPPPRNLEPPPSYIDNDLVRLIISMVNEATAAIPCWDEYVKTNKVTRTCAEAQKLDRASI